MNVEINETQAKVKDISIKIVQLIKFNLGTKKEPHMVKVNSKLQPEKVLELEEVFREYKDVFTWTYKDLKVIPL
jgi:hypothetical protein